MFFLNGIEISVFNVLYISFLAYMRCEYADLTIQILKVRNNLIKQNEKCISYCMNEKMQVRAISET